jgi:hypothetical protein
MERQVIGFDNAQLAKEKGFDVETLDFYSLRDRSFYQNKELIFHNHNDESFGPNRASAPSQSRLQKWLREKHNIHVLPIITDHPDGYIYSFDIKKGLTRVKLPFNEKHYRDTYEYAMELGLQEALKLI